MPVPHQQPSEYSYAQLERLWLDAGGPSDQASRAAATAEAESRGNPDAQYPGQTIAPGTGSWNVATGLWQILGKPSGGDWSAADLTSPIQNARMAVAKYQEGGDTWDAWAGDDWSQFYRAHVPPARSVPDEGGRRLPYANPLRDVQGLQPERVDMGVDYGGSGPIYALGPGTITNVYNSGWPGGTFIGERLSSGPLAGHYVYAAEDIEPSVQVGQQVDSSTVIGNLTGGGIETGFASPPGTGDALGASQFGGSNATAYGKAYSDLLHSLGAPAGTMSGPVTGDLPSWLGWIKDIPIIGPILGGGGGSGGGGGLFSIPSDIVNFFSEAERAVVKVEHAIDWLINPGHWVRIFAGIGGSFFVIWGLWAMSRTGRAYSANVPVIGSVPVPEGGQLAPAMGIASVTVGAILLFVAFHNLPADVTDFGSLLGYYQSNLQSGASSGAAQGGLGASS